MSPLASKATVTIYDLEAGVRRIYGGSSLKKLKVIRGLTEKLRGRREILIFLYTEIINDNEHHQKLI